MTLLALVVIDALRADHLGCYGASVASTPHIDALARRGVLFERAISQSTWTRPAMASLMTGLYPSQHGLLDLPRRTRAGVYSANGLDPNIPTLAELLRRSNYGTAAFLEGNAHLRPEFGITRGFERIDWSASGDAGPLVKRLGEWLREGGAEHRFAYVHLMEVHDPREERREGFLRRRGLVGGGRDGLAAAYASAVERADRVVGAIVTTVSRATPDHLIAVTADHGEELGDHGSMLAHGRSLHGELARVPLIIASGDGRARIVREPVELIDAGATFLGRAGAAPGLGSGKDLMEPAKEEGSSGRVAFAELLHEDGYARSASTSTYQMIESFRFARPLNPTAPEQLRPGDRVVLKGTRGTDGSLTATRLARVDSELVKLRGPLEQLDTQRGSLVVAGMEVAFGNATKFVGRSRRRVDASELSLAQPVTVYIKEAGNRALYASKVKSARPGGKLKIQAPIEAVQRLPGDVVAVRLLGEDVLVPTRSTTASLRETIGEVVTPHTVRLRILHGDFLERSVELYDVATDPAETVNLSSSRPDETASLVAALDRWGERIAAGDAFGGTVEISEDTVDQLRTLGYIE